MSILLLAGCTGSVDSSDGPTSDVSSSQAPSAGATSSPTASASAAPEPSPASSAGPAVNIPVPVKPALADENSAEGLEAFTEYWFELFSYGYETNDWAPFDAVTDPGCRTCAKTREVVADYYANGGWMDGGKFELLDFGTDLQMNTSGSFQAYAEYRQADLIYYDPTGSATPADAPESSVNAIFALYEDDAWYMLDFGKPEGT
ncbi:hypothetical protein E8P82_09440 [Arthrobacter echini]|uniref:DUF6318 domain-containing protein n=1 Tax=Arthrobacter echini TaxID=1529066 RepID=A0A4S5E441_9MICC|nr:DUF6318 family protein [Arthrobacter echini]THJ66216.1 hypothetical protein E8P82_09440 [Arthrobacter echini]